MTPARSIALDLLDQIQLGDHTLDHLLLQADHRIRLLNRADRALVHALVYGVLRWQARLDWIIDHLTSRPGKKIDERVRIILRLGLFQLQYLNRVPAPAAVNTSVELARKKRRKWATGFINGVLRRAANQADHIVWPNREKDPVRYLAVRHSFPVWLIERWKRRWGIDSTEQLCEKINTIPQIYLRANTLCTTRQKVVEEAAKEAETADPTPHCPEGVSISSPHRPFTRWPIFNKGWFQIQNEAAQCIGHLVSPEPGQLVWDACAGLGTKTAHLAQLMNNQGRIVATDLYEHKLTSLELEMERLGISIVQSFPADLSQPGIKGISEKFERILLDAPCSGLGVLQKNPDGKWRVNAKTIAANSQRQLALLENVSPYLKSDGLLVYAVCSFEPEENQQVVDGFLQKHPEFVIDHPRLDQVENHDKLVTAEGFVQTYPHRHGMDGFFAAVFRKRE